MRTLRDVLTPLSVLMMAGVMLYDHASPRLTTASAAAPTVSGVALGRAYAPVLVSSYAEAWVAASKTLEEGKSVADAQKSLQETWRAARVEAFTRDVQPDFALVLPEGTEPADPAKRAQVVRLWRAFARGLKSGR